MKGILMGLVFAAATGCAALKGGASKELDIREAAFRHAFKEDAALGPSFCLSVEGVDAGEALLARLRDDYPAVKKASECASPNGGGMVPDMAFRLGKIGWKSETEAVVPITVSAGPMAATGYSYILKIQKGRWSVVKTDLLWVS